ncbi:hypothetical protein CTA1_4268 [Colletotrichum tanaceti]|uniref:Uncharacterized protein n=1 Tax=Colletotrichum tanaceti TaxID=1306861 RepID=A0A4U6XII0_9PEZI|nr:hypothetical protein CTA1_4268 [Colletotrichum tanaceti]
MTRVDALGLQRHERVRRVPLPRADPEPAGRDADLLAERRRRHRRARDALVLGARGDRGARDVERLDLAAEVGPQRLHLNAGDAQALGDVGPRAREDVGLGPGPGQVRRHGRRVEEPHGHLDERARRRLDELPGDVGRPRRLGDDDVLRRRAGDEVGARALHRGVHLVGAVRGRLDDGLDHGQPRGDPALPVLVRQPDAARLGEEHDGLAERDGAVADLGVARRLLQHDVVGARGPRDVGAPAQAAALHGGGDGVGEHGLGHVPDGAVDVGVLHGRELAVLRVHPLRAGAVGTRRAVLVAVDADVRREARDEPLDVAGLLPRELGVVAVRVQVGRQVPLEVGHAVRVVPRQHHDVDPVEERGGPGGVGVQLAQQREEGLVARRLVAVDAALHPDAHLAGAAGVGVGCEPVVDGAVRGREVDVGDRAALFGLEVGVVVGHPLVARRERAEEVVCASFLVSYWARGSRKRVGRRLPDSTSLTQSRLVRRAAGAVGKGAGHALRARERGREQLDALNVREIGGDGFAVADDLGPVVRVSELRRRETCSEQAQSCYLLESHCRDRCGLGSGFSTGSSMKR